MNIISKLTGEIHYRLQGTKFERIPGSKTAYRTLVSVSGETVVHGGVELEPITETNTHYAKGYEQEVVDVFKELIESGDTILELGCSIGYFTTLFSKLVRENGHVVGYEANMERYNVLKKNLELNNCDNVKIHNLAVGEETDHGVFSNGGEAFEANIVKLDEHLEIAPDIVKADIEGAEINAFLGADRILSEHQPIIVCEVHPQKITNFGKETDDLKDLLEKHDYASFKISNSGETIQTSVEENVRSHYLFKPK